MEKNEGWRTPWMKDEPEWRTPWKMQFHWTEKLLPFESVSEKKLKKIVSSRGNKIFFEYWTSSNCNNGFQNNVNERTLFPLKIKSVATGCNKGFV